MKRLIVCCDGTWAKLSSKYPTNVLKIAQSIKQVSDDGIPQIVFYDEGIGTDGFVDKYIGGAFGKGLSKNIQDAYRFLCMSYSPGDEIYMFGFSRGAYTVRSLCGFINCSGLLTRQNIRHSAQAYELYVDNKQFLHKMDKGKKDVREEKRISEKKEELKKYTVQDINITLLACFDTVGSLGVPDLFPFIPIDNWLNRKLKFHDTNLSDIIENALHAVAIDEIRKVFYVTPMKKKLNSRVRILKEKWFPGDHGCIGGGEESLKGLSNCTLHWILDEIKNIGLKIDIDIALTGDTIIPDYNAQFEKPGLFFRAMGKKTRAVSNDFNDISIYAKKRWKEMNSYRPKNLKTKFEHELETWDEAHFKSV